MSVRECGLAEADFPGRAAEACFRAERSVSEAEQREADPAEGEQAARGGRN